MMTKILLGIVVILILFGLVKLYLRDSATVEQALLVEMYIKDYCQTHNRYPEIEKLESQFSHLYPNQEWFYWPNETWTAASFQYPMTLPLPSAIGSSKVSEFFPIIYSYVVRHPCKDLIKEASSEQ